jgi:hypothetical protein
MYEVGRGAPSSGTVSVEFVLLHNKADWQFNKIIKRVLGGKGFGVLAVYGL